MVLSLAKYYAVSEKKVRSHSRELEKTEQKRLHLFIFGAGDISRFTCLISAIQEVLE